MVYQDYLVATFYDEVKYQENERSGNVQILGTETFLVQQIANDIKNIPQRMGKEMGVQPWSSLYKPWHFYSANPYHSQEIGRLWDQFFLGTSLR